MIDDILQQEKATSLASADTVCPHDVRQLKLVIGELQRDIIELEKEKVQ
jgi:hypothetical protein